MTATLEHTTTSLPTVDIPLDRIDPSETNRKVDDVTGLKASIEEIGLLQPIVVRPRHTLDGERYEIIAGERRWLAFTELGRETIPAIVRHDDDSTAFVAQLIENVQRDDLEPMFEAHAYQQLLDLLGCSQHELAERIGVSQATISKRISLLDLPPAAIAALDSQEITVKEATEFARLTEHPKILAKELEDHLNDVKSGFLEWTVHERVSQALEDAEEDLKFEAELQALRDAGVTVLQWDTKKKYARLNETWRTPNVNVDAEKHKAEPCRGVLVPSKHGRYYIEVCIDWKRHDARGESDLKNAKQAVHSSHGGRTVQKKTDAEKKAAAKKRENDRARRDFMVDALTKPPPELLWRVVANRLLSSYMAPQVAKLACELLGLKVPEKGYHRHEDTLGKYARKGDAELAHAVYAVTLAQGEHNGYSYGKDHQALLKAAGYKATGKR